MKRSTKALLQTYPWPGNVRELAHVMERAVFRPGGPCVQAADLDLARAKATSQVVVESGGNVHVDFSSGGISLDDVEQQLIVAALRVTAWNRTRAARLLGLTKETLRYRMEKYQLRPLA